MHLWVEIYSYIYTAMLMERESRITSGNIHKKKAWNGPRMSLFYLIPTPCQNSTNLNQTDDEMRLNG